MSVWIHFHVIGFSDLVDLWVIKLKKPMILCARSTSRSREQRTKRRLSSENTWKVCLFCSENNTILWWPNMADTFLEKFTRCARVYGPFFCLTAHFGCWLAGQNIHDYRLDSHQTRITCLSYSHQHSYIFLCSVIFSALYFSTLLSLSAKDIFRFIPNFIIKVMRACTFAHSCCA